MSLDEVIRLSISEAAKLFGVNAQTIRRAIKNAEVSYVVVQGRYKVSFESLIKWSERHVTISNKLESRGIGQFVGQWKIRNRLYSPNPEHARRPRTHALPQDALPFDVPTEELLKDPQTEPQLQPAQQTFVNPPLPL